MIELSTASPFWEDPATLLITGEDREAVMRICVRALDAAGYEVRDGDGELVEPDDEESPDA